MGNKYGEFVIVYGLAGKALAGDIREGRSAEGATDEHDPLFAADPVGEIAGGLEM